MIVHDHWLLTPFRAAIHLPSRTAVIADVHLGYAEARRRGGDAIPIRPVAAVFAPLGHGLTAYRVRRLVIAGDLFEAGLLPPVMEPLCKWLLDAGVELVAVVPGNHDKRLGDNDRLPVRLQGVELGGWRVVHGDEPAKGRVVQGHEHPCLRKAGLQAPCFLIGRGRLILPAFSPDAAGVNVLADPRWRNFRMAAIAEDRVLDFGTPPTFRAAFRARQRLARRADYQ
jgi:metallophosphoesterase superfamily enzyme